MNQKRNQNRRGITWSAIERFSIQGSQFVVSLVVARMLLPEDYGIIAMLSIFIAVSTSLIDSGMAQALIQRPNRTESDKTTALVFNIAAALLIYGTIYISAPLISQFYGVEQLTSVVRVYSLVLVINSFVVVQQALIAIQLDFKRQTQATLTGVVIGGIIAIILAWRGYGVWALVVQQLTSCSVSALLLWAMSSWRPRSAFSWESFRGLSRFGSKIMLSGLLHTLYTNLYTVVIGRAFAPAALGLYNRATTISALPSSNISVIVERALYPILCSKQSDINAAADTLLQHLARVCFGVFPIMVGISIMAEPLTIVLLGEQWVEVTPLLRAVALANMWDPIMKFSGSIIRSQGNSGDFLRAEVLKKLCGIAILILSLPYGVEAMCWGLLLYAFVDMAIIIFFTRKISPSLGYRGITRRLAPTTIATFLMGASVWFLSHYTSHLNAILQLTTAFVAGGAIYILASLIIRRTGIKTLNLKI